MNFTNSTCHHNTPEQSDDILIQQTINTALKYYTDNTFLCNILRNLSKDNIIQPRHFLKTKQDIFNHLFPFQTLNEFKKHHNITTPNRTIFEDWTKFKQDHPNSFASNQHKDYPHTSSPGRAATPKSFKPA